MIDFNCPKCGEVMSVPDCLMGETETCPSCHNEVDVPIVWTKADAERLKEATRAYADGALIHKNQYTDKEKEQHHKAVTHLLAKREWAKMHGICEPGSLPVEKSHDEKICDIRREAQKAQFEAFLEDCDEADPAFTWVAVNGSDACKDCQLLHGTSLIVSQWRKEGMPGERDTICKRACQCQLVPNSFVAGRSEIDKD